MKILKIFGYFIFSLYLLVLAVAINQGPLISLQSFILGVLGLVAIVVGTSKIAKLLHLVDTPDGRRKQHKGSVPLIGGLVLFVSLLYGNFVFGIEIFYQYLLVSLVPILIIGTIDGIKDIIVPISIRIIAQILASWIIILTTDIYVRDLGNLFGTGVIQLNQFGIPFTIFSVVGLCNAFNMLDGRDGLAASVAITIFSGLFLILFSNGIMYNWGLILILSLLVFLAFNLSLFGDHRRIFLGDHGSTSLGHIIGWCLVYLSQETEIITPISVLYFVAVPFLDAVLTFIRRIRSASSIFHGDERHFHHLLSNLGFSNYIILLIITSFSGLAVLGALASIYLGISEYILFLIFVTIFIFLFLLGRANPIKNNK